MERTRGVPRRLAAALVVVAALVSWGSGAPASAEVATATAPSGASTPEVAAPVAADVQAEVVDGPVDVIVVTSAPGDEVADAVLSEVPEGSVTAVEAGPAAQVSATVDAEGLEALRRAPFVERIIENGKNFVSADTWAENVELPSVRGGGWDGSGQSIAVLDSGVQSNHPFLQGKVVAEGCFSSGGTAGTASLCPGGGHTQFGAGAATPCALAIIECQHGTHVAGIAAGGPTSSGGRTLEGVAPAASIVAVQIFTEGTTTAACDGPAPCVFAYDSDLNEALHWIDTQVQAGATGFQHLAAVNLSLGGAPFPGPCDESPTKPYVDALAARGVITVAATGNAGLNSSAFPGSASPACISTVVSVGATSLDATLDDYSNLTGSTTLLAPGGPIVSSTPGSTFGALTGTSMSTPVVSGAVALLKQKGLTSRSQIVSRLTTTGGLVATAFGSRPEVELGSALLGVPNSPRNPTAVGGDGHVDLAWSAPSFLGDGTLTGYAVTSVPASSGCTTTSATSCRVSGLQIGTTYTFTVQAIGSGGPGGRSRVAATPRTLPGAPQGVTGTPGSRSIKVSWSAASTGGAPIQSYRATAQPGGQSCTSAGATTCTITGLTEGVAYTVTVTATNEAGTGPSSAPSAPVIPFWTPSLPSGPPFGSVDVAVGGGGSVTVAGWAIDPDRAGPIAVHVYVDDVLVGTTADGSRPDVAAAFDGYGPAHGYSAVVPAASGRHTACAYGIDGGGQGNALLGCRSVVVPTGAPFGSVDVAVGGPRSVTIAGWAIDPDLGSPIAVHVYVDGALVGATADRSRPDVDAAFPGYGPGHGYAAEVPASPGTHTACAYGIDPAHGNALLGCRRVLVATGAPFGALDVVSTKPGSVSFGGWAIDPDSGDPIAVHVYVDGIREAAAADQLRPDVGAAFVGYGSRHGYSIEVRTTGGPHLACAYAIDSGGGTNTRLGCRAVVLPTGPPFGALDVVARSGSSVTVAGWAIDPDTREAVDVRIVVGGLTTTLSASGARSDVGQVHPAYGDGHGYGVILQSVPPDASVCAVAVNVGGGADTPLGCRVI